MGIGLNRKERRDADLPSWTGRLPTAFIIALLIALFSVPMLLSWRADALRSVFGDYTTPARERVDDIELALARESSAIRGYLLAEDPSFLRTFYEHRAMAAAATEDLHRLAQVLGPDVRERLDDLITAQERWAEPNEAVISGALPRQTLIDQLSSAQRDRYTAAVEAAKALNRAIGSVEEEVLDELRTVERAGVYASALLIPLVLLATMLLVWNNRRQRRLAAHLGRQFRMEEALRRAAHALTVASTEEDMYQGVVQHVVDFVPASGFYIEVVDGDGQAVEVVAATGTAAARVGLRLPYDASATCEAYASGVSASGAAHVAPIRANGASGPDGAGRKGRSVVAAAFASERAPIGALVVERDAGEEGLHDDEAARLRILADLVSLAVRRVRLIAREQQAREKAESAVRTRDEVLGIVSHDLRSPLAAITLGIDMLADPAVVEGRRRYVELLKTTAQRMNRLIQDLLDVARLEAGQKLSITPVRVDVEDLVHETCAAFELQAKDQSQHLACTVAKGTPPVRADRDRLFQVLANLISNALKFTPPGGRITVAAVPEGDRVLFQVRDTGTGIAAEDLKCIFDPFWQVSRTARLGAGLGLPIAKSIVHAHGGDIWVESEPGVGTTFFFTLSAVPQEDEPVHQDTPQASGALSR